MTDSIGTARLDIVVDTTNMEAGVAKAKRSQEDLAQSATKAAQQGEQNTRRRVASLEKQIATLGKSREEVIRWRIEQQTSGKVAGELKAKLDAQVASLGAQTKAFAGTNKTARELQFAMRGLPAQLTDIGTSLASGQKPMLVLLQQGGQLKDMFGGIRPAAQALGGAFLRMVNPATLAAGAVATLVMAWNQGEKDAAAFTNALLATGNEAGRTQGQLEAMVGTLSALQGVTAGTARDAIQQVAQSGRFAGDQFDLVAKAAARMQASTGQAIDATIKKFEEIAKSPTDALLKLNETEHFLTEAQYARVRALEEEGRKQDAAAEAARIYAGRLDEIAAAAEAARPHLSQMWAEAKKGASDAWNATKDFAEFLAAAGGKFRQRSVREQFGFFGAFNFISDLRNADPMVSEPVKPVAGAVNSDQKRAAQQFDREGLQFATDRAKMERDIAEARKLGVQAGKSELEIEQRIAAIRASYARKGAKSGRSLDNANARAALQTFQDQLKVEQGAIANATQLLQAQYSARLVTVQKYYEDQRSLAQRGTAAEEQAIQGQISVLRARNVTGKDAADVARQLATLEAELAKVRADGATKLAILNIQEADALKQRQLAAKAYQSALDENNAALQDQINTMVARVGMGEREFEIQTKVNEAYRDQAKELLALARQRDAGELDAETYEARVAALKDATDRQVQIVRDGYDRMAEAQANWANGAIKALKDYVDQAADVAGQTYSLFTDAFKGAEDVLTDFITKGRADWKGYFDNLAAEITRFAVRQQLAKLAKKFLPGLMDGQESQAGALSSAAGQLAASATPLYGAAAALSSSAAALAAAGAGSAANDSSFGEAAGSIFDLFTGNGFGFAKGAAFADGNVTAFATGGVVASPTYFPMSNRRLGLMGEDGPEAIVPLHKGPDGKLGIRMESNRPVRRNGGDVYVTVPVQGNISRQTKLQAGQEVGRAVARARRNS